MSRITVRAPFPASAARLQRPGPPAMKRHHPSPGTSILGDVVRRAR